VAPDVPDALVGDALRVRQVLTNLVGHAFKVTTSGEAVETVWAKRCSRTNDSSARPARWGTSARGSPTRSRSSLRGTDKLQGWRADAEG
jgi:hypothetical protein